MSVVLERTLLDAPAAPELAAAAAPVACFHCGEPCIDARYVSEERRFCCQGCLVVHDLLEANGLARFYDLERHPGVKIRRSARREQWAYLDEPATQERLLDFTDGKLSRVTFEVPAMHCVACVWLLENLYRLHTGVGKSVVNFPRREVSLSYAARKITLSEVVALLASLGYEPRLTLSELDKAKPDLAWRRRWLQMGVAGFAFGNIMLFSIPTYFGLDRFSGPLFTTLFGYLSLALALPVVAYSASDYWRSASVAVRQRVLTLDVPIALGLGALYVQSAVEILTSRGGGYLDSLAGLVFFLLCGRAFQRKTHNRIAFDRDYKCFFPLAVMRRVGSVEESVALSNLRVGDRLVLRHGDLIPADARLISRSARIDYSFVSGESEPVTKQAGDYLYAGGRHIDGGSEVETVKAVSQSYLASLWDHEAFRKEREGDLNTLTNRYSRRFTRLVIGVAIGAGLFWVGSGDAARGLKAFASVLIVACPCALALAAPFALGTAQRLLARLQVFFKNAGVLERMSRVDTIVFDKTGTLTAPDADGVRFLGAPKMGELGAEERVWVWSLTRHSTHPHAVRIGVSLASAGRFEPSTSFTESPGEGIGATVSGHELRLGSRGWLEAGGVPVPGLGLARGSTSYLAIDGECRGAFVLTNALRPEAGRLLKELGGRYKLALLSGDNEKERDRFRALFPGDACLHFNQSPFAKLSFIRRLQDSGKTVMMVGDGLNDAGALRQSDLGVAVVEEVGAFCPASDVILGAGLVPRLAAILRLARQTSRIVRVSFGISAVYNLAGVSVAAAGLLSPVICAVLMPLSSVSVVLFACGATNWAARKAGLINPLPAKN